METARRRRDGKEPLFFRLVSQTADHDDLRQNATTCDAAMICGKRRRITVFYDNASAPRPHK
jgi:hypothetical protein